MKYHKGQTENISRITLIFFRANTKIRPQGAKFFFPVSIQRKKCNTVNEIIRMYEGLLLDYQPRRKM